MPHPAIDGRKETLLSDCRTIDEKRLFLGRARLTDSELHVRGWAQAKRIVIRLPLDRIRRLERSANSLTPVLSVGAEDGRSFSLGLAAPGLWRWAIRSRLPEGHPLSVGASEPPADTARQPCGYKHQIVYQTQERPGTPVDRPADARQRWRPLGDLVSG